MIGSLVTVQSSTWKHIFSIFWLLLDHAHAFPIKSKPADIHVQTRRANSVGVRTVGSNLHGRSEWHKRANQRANKHDVGKWTATRIELKNPPIESGNIKLSICECLTNQWGMNTKHMIVIQSLLVPKHCKLIAILRPATRRDTMIKPQR